MDILARTSKEESIKIYATTSQDVHGQHKQLSSQAKFLLICMFLFFKFPNVQIYACKLI